MFLLWCLASFNNRRFPACGPRFHATVEDHVIAVAQSLCAAATHGAFALWCCGGDRVVTWGKAAAGGDSREVHHQLKDVRQIEGRDDVFAALLGDESVVTWGTFSELGLWIDVPGQLRNVQRLHSTGDAFASLHHDGTVSTWGDSEYGGDSSQVQSQLTHVRDMCGTAGEYSWTCNLCHEVLRNNLKRSLACSRLRHVKKAHPGQAKKVQPAFKRRAEIAMASSELPADQRAWHCPKCGKGLAWMSATALRLSQKAHEQECYGLTAKQMKAKYYKRQSWIDKHKKLNAQNSATKLSRTNDAIADYNATGKGGWAFRIPSTFATSNSDEFGCARCTVVFQKFKTLTQHKCVGERGRHKIMARYSRQQFWKRKREQNDEAVRFFVKQWKLAPAELQVLEKAVSVKGKKKAPPPTACAWYHDLVQDGDVEPHPGPCSQSFRSWMVNAGGGANTWSLARLVTKERPAIAIVQEHSLIPTKQSDVARFLEARGYRSWWAATPPVQNIKGQWYTSGGVAVWVRQDKPCREVQRLQDFSGQALMLQLDHCFLVASYLPPGHGTETEALSILDQWVCSVPIHTPLVLCGDFNHEPQLADRWTALAETGAARAVTDSNGVILPTRWVSQRCIDWMWCSHPHLIRTLHFTPVALADHRMLEWETHVAQSAVQSYKSLPTRKLEPPTSVAQTEWQQALSQAWADLPVPHMSTTEEEWTDFCWMAEQAQLRALHVCNVVPERGLPRARCKGSDIQILPLQPNTFRLKQTACMLELKLRKLLGRTKEALLHVNRGAEVPNVLLQKIWRHPLLRGQRHQGLQQVHDWAEHELKMVLQQEQVERLQQWRSDMRHGLVKARKWVKKQDSLPVAAVFDNSYKNGAASTSNQESLEAIRSFWDQIWGRVRPDVNVAFQHWQQHVPAGQALAWDDLTPEELHQHAKRLRGSAGGPCGWTGTEVADWPLKAWQIFSELLSRWQARSELPHVWSSVKQVHLQKPGAKLRMQDNAMESKDMRPISVQCVMWRIVASAWTRRRSTRTWIRSWAPAVACGGLEGRGVALAVDRLLENYERGGILLSLDYQKCFDRLDPTLGLQCLRHLGCPPPMVQMLQLIWRQKRWLTYKGEFLPNPSMVDTSLPQGDAASPLTLLAVMTGLTLQVQAQEPLPFCLVTYLDDRNMIASDAAQAARLMHAWSNASMQVGLRENSDKIRVVPRKKAWRQQLLDAGFGEQQVVQCTRVLGVDFHSRLGGKERPTQVQRIADSKVRLDRIALLPVSNQRKASLAASLVTPKASWGAWLAPHLSRKLHYPVRKAVGGGHSSASPHLFFMLAGHGLHVEFVAGMQAFTTLAQLVRSRPRPWPARSARGSWLGAVRLFLKNLGWTELGNWRWQHAALTAPHDTLDLTVPITKAQQLQEQHQVRETWRRDLFSKFLRSGRRDAQMAQHVLYSEPRMTNTRTLFRNLDSHGRGVLVGAIVSNARFDKIQTRSLAGWGGLLTGGAPPYWNPPPPFE